ncbi:MAG: subtilase, partial [Proteobacteria bacterium]
MSWNLIQSVSTSMVVAGISVLAVSTSVEAKNNPQSNLPNAVPGEFLVRMKGDFSTLSAVKSLRASLVQSLGVSSIQSIESLAMDSRIQKVTIQDHRAEAAALDSLRANPAVRYAEPNYIYRKFTAPNDLEFTNQWDMVNSGQADSAGKNGLAGADINILPVWERGITGSRDVMVAVIDTGVDYTHPDLAANIYTNPSEIPGDGIDNDANGIIDDVHGVNFVDAKNGTGVSMDDNEHGTHCAGTIGGVGGNGVGIAGVNWNTTILPVKFLSGDGSGSSEGAINGIKYAVKMGAKVLSNSWGGGAYSEALYDAIKEANDAGVLFVAASGNEANDNEARGTYPASYNLPNIISVAAIDNNDRAPSFSNFGKTKVHVAAPGVRILSTVPGGKYDSFSGTSMACPHVAGMAALLWSNEPGLTALEIKERLIRTST